MKWILLIILFGAIGMMIWNYFCKKSEMVQIEGAYGQVIEVNGKDMVVDVLGEENETTIILLPGWGSPSPVLEFLPLAEKLSRKYQVITIEPFGYGLSDEAGNERKIDTIVDELHECTQKLGCDQYYLMAHSLSGLYSLYWANTYPNEVRGFIGIDSSVPKQSDGESLPISMITLNKISAYLQKIKNVLGITRIQSIAHLEKVIYVDWSYGYSYIQLKVFQILFMNRAYNESVIDELQYTEENLKTVREMKFPEDIPVLQFVSSNNCGVMESWCQLHKDVITESVKSKVICLYGGHYLHFERKIEIVSGIEEFID